MLSQNMAVVVERVGLMSMVSLRCFNRCEMKVRPVLLAKGKIVCYATIMSQPGMLEQWALREMGFALSHSNIQIFRSTQYKA
jgi:hypothetical protein